MIESNLISLHQEPAVNNATQFAQIACNLKIEELVLGYENLIQAAPARHERGKLYLTGRTGTTSSGRDSNRREEHLAVALYNASRAGKHFALPDGRALQIVDYQTPLKARQDDKGVGKVDLFAFLGGNLSCVIELKVMGSRNNLGDTPLRALLEGLTYCAIVEANARQIAIEAQREFQVRLTSARPVLAVIAPDDYWRAFLTRRTTGSWLSGMRSLIADITATLNMEIHLLVLRNGEYEMGLAGQSAQLTGDCEIASLDQFLASRGQ